MALRFHNTATGKKEAFGKEKGEKVGLYSCGPTVYHFAHVGNLRHFVFSDVLGRTLRYFGFELTHVMNITDVGHMTEDTGEDKIEHEAKRQQKTALEIAEFYTNEFMQDLKALNVETSAMKFPRATVYIKEQIALVKKLEEKGFAYVISDGIYFDTEKDKNYGALAKLEGTSLLSGARVEENPEKHNPADFALWKFSPKGEEDATREQEWESPWGTGFPGWHIECSAMAMKLINEHIDIHTGGHDLIFPHHVNEIAQSENATGEKFVDIWMHNGFVNMKGDKMAKSDGNVIRLFDLRNQGFEPIAYRYLLLGTHYKKPIDWSEEAMTGAQNALDRLWDRFLELGEEKGTMSGVLVEKFNTALEDDLNTPLALSYVWETFDEKDLSDKDKRATLLEFDKVLGLGLTTIAPIEISKKIHSLVNAREEVRKNKDFEAADTLRRQIEKEGFLVKDTPEGPKLSRKRGV